ncbi:MAG: DegT/DnrJ/EryC1/StrS family aminotransferase [Anaerolineaceae bacterium]
MSTAKPFVIPMSSPDLTNDDRQAVMSVFENNYLSMGPQIEAFEAAFRELTGCEHAIAVNSGTAGLHLCVRAAGIEAGDYVITTPFSFVASTNVILFENAIPIFVDVDPNSGNIDPQLAAEAARDLAAGGQAAKRWLPRRGNDRPGSLKGILPVDVFGQPADMDAIRKIADEHHVPVIEDSCEALGAEYKGRPAGMLGDFGVFAFYPNKQITTAEGGLIVTNDPKAAYFMRAMRNQGRAPGDNWLQHTHLGYNYRMDEMSAALGVSQMKRLPALMAKRQQVADWYLERLPEIPSVEAPYTAPTTSRSSWFVFVIRLPKGADRMKIAERLGANGIPVRPYFLPIHLQPYLMEKFGYLPGDFPITEDLGERGLALPFSGVMTEAQVDQVCRTLQSVL